MIILLWKFKFNKGYQDKTVSHKVICESIISLVIKLYNINTFNLTIIPNNLDFSKLNNIIGYLFL